MAPKRVPKILIVDDDPEFGAVARELVELENFETRLTTNPDEALEWCEHEQFNAVLLDLMLGKVSGIDVMREIHQRCPDLPVIVVTAHGSVESATEAVRAEAFDYIGKPFRVAELLTALRRAVEWHAARRQPGQARPEEVSSSAPPPSIIGRSPAMVAVYRVLARVAATDSTVLISGESGTGKELIARALHENSPRAQHPFIPVNCGAFTETLLESELFGHVRGAFTGAQQQHRGIFETANGGTVFLDEISETSPAFQVKLLRVLQEQEVRPVGASEARRVNVRIVAATNRRVPDLFQSDDFRQDLLYRLSVINISLPPLRERAEDVPLLAEHFLQRLNGRLGKHVTITPETLDWLSHLHWPGNVRELENAIERAVTLNVGGRLLTEDFTQFTPFPLEQARIGLELSNSAPATALQPATSKDALWVCQTPCTLEEVERAHILAMMRFTKGNKLRAAELLGIGRYSLYRKAERLGINLDGLPLDPAEAG
jgi:two-component system response regulator AtoC